MGIINLNDDSFWSGSRCNGRQFGSRVEQMLKDGADILDLGAVSTRPGSEEVGLEEEWRRISAPLQILKSMGLPPGIFSFDTFRAEIVDRILQELGYSIIVNDIMAGGFSTWVVSGRCSMELGGGNCDAAFVSPMLVLVGRYSLPYIAMHMRGTPQTMQNYCNYEQGVVEDVLEYFSRFNAVAERYGVKDYLLDPGFGFSKSLEQNWELFDALPRIKERSGKKILVGISRKSMICRKLGITPAQALEPTIEYNMKAASMGASILRVHDVREMVDALNVR